MVVLKREAQEVRALLQRCPSLLQEKTILGQTPFHLAAANPEILEILIDSDANRLLDTKTYGNKGGCVADYAVLLSGRICSNGTSWEACSNCPCVRPFNVLQAHGIRCNLQPFIEGCFAYASHSCRIAVILALKSSTEQVKDIARRNLSPPDIIRYKLDTSQALDYWVSEVIDILQREGISIPAELRTELGMVSQHSVYNRLAKNYEGLPSHCIAECFYQHGFLDIDIADLSGGTPLSYCACSFKPNWNYILWLVRHGAEISRPVPVPTSRKDNAKYNADITAAYLISPPWSSEVAAFQQLFPMVASMKVHDQCQCGCVEKGCHTLKRLFTDVWDQSSADDLYDTSPDRSIGLFGTFQQIPVDFSQWEHACLSALRAFTFEALGLRYTCCDLNRGARYSPEEVSDIQSEDRGGLDLLEEFMGEFVEEYRRRNMKLDEFIISYWASRMDKVLQEVRLTEEERRDAECLGVRWDTVTYDDEEELKEHYWWVEQSSSEYWVKRLDKIAPV